MPSSSTSGFTKKIISLPGLEAVAVKGLSHTAGVLPERTSFSALRAASTSKAGEEAFILAAVAADISGFQPFKEVRSLTRLGLGIQPLVFAEALRGRPAKSRSETATGRAVRR